MYIYFTYKICIYFFNNHEVHQHMVYGVNFAFILYLRS